MSLYEFDLLSRDAQIALTEFDLGFSKALEGAAVPWARALGRYRASKMLKTVWPIPISAAGYTELTGDMRYRKLAAKSLTLLQKTWQDGVEELVSVIEAPDFIGFDQEPAAMAAAAVTAPNAWVAGLLKDGASIVCDLDGENFFSTAHPVNVFDDSFGTFSNYAAAGEALTLENYGEARAKMRKVKAPNGDPMGLRVTHLIVTPDLEETARGILNKDWILEGGVAQSNIQKGSAELVVLDEYSGTSTDWFTLSANKPGMYPWVVQDTGDVERIVCDKSSQKYKDTLKVSYAAILRGNAGLAMPHCIHKFKA